MPGKKPAADSSDVCYLVFDVESVADGDLVASIKYPREKLTKVQAVARYREERRQKYGTDFIPYTFQKPVSIAVAKVDVKFRLLDLVTLDEPEYRTHVMVENFWRGWLQYDMPTLISFNGRGFDIPLLELAAFRFGIAVPDWFNMKDSAYNQKRNRYNLGAHLDLQDLFTNFGATRLNGGLNLIANLIGIPGKMDISGDKVQDLYDKGEVAAINDYCRCDVLDTYFVFLRAMVMTGKLKLEQEQKLFVDAKKWLQARTDDYPIYSDYLEKWQPWENPWEELLPLEG
ncbi:MAG: 3'-5' exonuclease [Pirellulaceae bacterium]